MRIGVFIKNTTLHKSYGGFETQNKLLCEGLASRGHEVHIFSPQKELTAPNAFDNGVEYIFVPCIFKRFSIFYNKNKNSWQNRSYAIFKEMHEKNKFDVVISQSSWGLGIIKHKNDLDIPVISISHGSKIGEYQTRIKSAHGLKDYVKLLIDLPHVFYNFFVTQRQFVHGADVAVAVSNAVKKQILDETFVPEEKIIVIHNGVDVYSFEKAAVRNAGEKSTHENIIELLYVGRVIRDKGIFVLVDAMKKLVPEVMTVKLSIIGEGEDMNKLKEYIKLNSLEDKINLEGQMPYEKVIERMSHADIFVLPSLRVEGFPMTLVEAMFAGLPVIASDIGGNSDAVENDITGYLVHPGNVDELCEKIIFLVRNEETRKKMSENALNKANNELTLDIMLDKYEKVLQGVINK